MARLRNRMAAHTHRILVVDDDPELLQSTVQLLSREGHDVRGESDPRRGIEQVRQWKPHLLLLDFYMPEMTGRDVVVEVRKFDAMVQVLLVTGYAGEQPARQLMASLDIQGYHDKADGPHRLMVLCDGALKHYRALRRLDRQRGYLQAIVAAAPQIGRLQPPEELFRHALQALGRLLGGGDGLIATYNHGLFIMDSVQEGVNIRAGTGRYDKVTRLSELPPQTAEVVRSGLQCATPEALLSGYVSIPLETRAGERGCMLLEGSALPSDAVGACEIFARQVILALENLMLYERATHDQLTQLYNRSFGEQRLEESLASGQRHGRPTSVIFLDIDRFKSLNDTYGHAAGDMVIRAVAGKLREMARVSDIPVRFGGEEMVVILPETDLEGAVEVAERLRASLASMRMHFEEHTLTVTASFGVATASSPQEKARGLLRRADMALYQAKQGGRNRVCVSQMPSDVQDLSMIH
jgi:two-component system cell cycle response regulator